MIGEIDIAGVFVPTLLVWAVVAFFISVPLRWVLTRLGFYRFVWYRGLFDLCLLVLLFGLVTVLTAGLHPGVLQP